MPRDSSKEEGDHLTRSQRTLSFAEFLFWKRVFLDNAMRLSGTFAGCFHHSNSKNCIEMRITCRKTIEIHN